MKTWDCYSCLNCNNSGTVIFILTWDYWFCFNVGLLFFFSVGLLFLFERGTVIFV